MTSAGPISVGPDALALTWVAVGSLIVELLALIVFLVRLAWWLSNRFALIDAAFAAASREIAQIRSDVGNDIAGRRVVAEARTDIASIKATVADLRERVERLEKDRERG